MWNLQSNTKVDQTLLDSIYKEKKVFDKSELKRGIEEAILWFEDQLVLINNQSAYWGQTRISASNWYRQNKAWVDKKAPHDRLMRLYRDLCITTIMVLYRVSEGDVEADKNSLLGVEPAKDGKPAKSKPLQNRFVGKLQDYLDMTMWNIEGGMHDEKKYKLMKLKK